MKESRKRSQGGGNDEAVGAKRARTPATSNETDEKIDADYEEIMALLSIDKQGEKNDEEAVTVNGDYEDITAFLSINDEEAVGVERARTPARSNEMDKNSDGDYEDVTALLSIDEEAASELAKLLQTTTSSSTKVRFIDDPYYSVPLIFQPSSSYLTINGNEESCGSSYSEKESSVMAGFDIVCRGTVDCCDVDRWFAAEVCGAWLNDHGEAALREAEAQACAEDFDLKAEARAEGSDQVKDINGWDCLVIDDEMLARFIGEDLDQV